MRGIAFLYLLFSIIANRGFASHVMGGHFEIEQISSNQYRIDFYGYMDCANGVAGFSFQPVVDVYENNTNLPVTSLNLTSGLVSTTAINLGDLCYNPGLCVEEWHFSRTFTVGSSSNGYYFTYDICCRNDIISNIIFPNFNGHTFYAQLPAYTSVPGGNHTPVFNPYNRDAYFCIDEPNCYDLSATDPDGDSLVYSVVTPFDEDDDGKPINEIVWENNYTASNPLNGTFILDSSTGMLCAQAASIGVFVFAIKVEEYRNGIKIGEVIKDYQWESLICDLPSSINYPFAEDTGAIYINESRCFDFIAEDVTATNDTLVLSATGNLFDYAGYVLEPSINGENTFDITYNNLSGQEESRTLTVVRENNMYKGYNEVGMRFCISPTNCNIYAEDSLYLDFSTFSSRCVGSDTITRRVYFKMDFNDNINQIPNVFSPNGDGKNDTYKLIGIYNHCYDVLHFEVYNRWGEIVYFTDDPDFEWDGTDINTNEKVPEGSYYGVLQGFFAGKEVTSRQPITVFR